MSKKIYGFVSLLIMLSVVLAACTPAAAPASNNTQAQPAATQAAAEPTATTAPAATKASAAQAPADANSLPRNETMYFNGQQWGAVVCWNPYSSSCNNAMAISQGDNARVTMFETPY